MTRVSLSRLFAVDINSGGSGLPQTNTFVAPPSTKKKHLQQRVKSLCQKRNWKEAYAISMLFPKYIKHPKPWDYGIVLKSQKKKLIRT